LAAGFLNPLIATLKPQKQTIIQQYSDWCTGVVGWAVTFGTMRRGLGGAAGHLCPSLLYQM